MLVKTPDWDIYPLFPTVVAAKILTEDLSELASIEATEYCKSAHSTAEGSRDLDLLKSYPQTKNTILNHFDLFKNSILKLSNTEVAMTTSWSTRTTIGHESQWHSHKNSWYSGVLYLETLVNGADIEFENPVMNLQSWSLPPTEWLSFNCESHRITPEKNLLIFFPSYLRHRITLHQTAQPRYSVAFNMIPVGTFGKGDSSISQLAVN